MKRRNFIKYGAGTFLTAPLLFSRYAPLYANRYASDIVSVSDYNASHLTFREGTVVNSDGVIVDKVLSFDLVNTRVAKMVDTAVLKLTGKKKLGKAWESLFPAGHPNKDTKIGIKLNFSYGDWRNDIENDWSKIYCPFGAKAAVTNAIINGLSQMMDGHFPVENITLIERMYLSGTRRFYPVIQGYRPVVADADGLFKDKREGACGLHWIYSTNPLELPEEAPRFIAAPDFTGEYQAPQRIYSAIYNNDFLINYAIAKDHRAAGITGAMKNNYGCTDNPFGTHGNEWNNDDTPYAGTRLCIPVFHKNVHANAPYILNVLDAITGVYEGGPLSGKIFHHNSLTISKDAVALDFYLLDMINKARVDRGFPPLAIEDGRTEDGHPNAAFLRIAAQKHEMGSLSLDGMHSYDLSGNDGSYELPALDNSHSLISEVRTNNNQKELNVFFDASGRNHVIESRIEDVGGRVIRSFPSITTRSSNATLSWDMKNDDGKTIGEGVYSWFVHADGKLHTSTINMNI